MYACDPKWWRVHGEEVRRVFRGERWTQQQPGGQDANEAACIADYALHFKPGIGEPGLGRERIHHGMNSGYQAINLAYLMGAREILLLGYDMQLTGGKRHFFGDHPSALRANTRYDELVAQFPALASDLKAEGVAVINCTRETALDCFPRVAIECVPSC